VSPAAIRYFLKEQQVRSPKVRLYIRVRLADGRYRYADPIWNRNRTLRAGYALVGGQPEAHAEGIYYVRFFRGDKRVWRAVSADADAAVRGSLG
jgi:hypothetical protein